MMLPAHIARKLPDYLEIVQSGTAALVLKMPAANVQAFFDCHGWGATSAKKVFVKLVKSMGEERIYLKFTNAAHGRQWTDIRAFTNLLASFCDEESEKEKCALGSKSIHCIFSNMHAKAAFNLQHSCLSLRLDIMRRQT